jgi:hypothetical protein
LMAKVKQTKKSPEKGENLQGGNAVPTFERYGPAQGGKAGGDRFTCM